jgi:hypothetical protein
LRLTTADFYDRKFFAQLEVFFSSLFTVVSVIDDELQKPKNQPVGSYFEKVFTHKKVIMIYKV